MKVIFIHHDFTRVGHCSSVLEEAGIPCFIQNASTHNVMTGLPIPSFYPRLCVTHDEDAERATELLREFIEGAQDTVAEENSADWECPQCGETVPGNFGSCWKCDALRPAP